MKTPTPHPHADFIAEAIKDVSRKIEGQHRDDGFEPSNLSHVIACAESWTFRFADTVKLVIVSSFTDEELIAIQGHHPATSGHINNIRNLANIVAARAIKDLPVLRCSLSGKALHDIYCHYKFDEGDAMESSFERVAAVAIDDYIKQVKAGNK